MKLREWTDGDLERIAQMERAYFAGDAWTEKMLRDTMASPYSWTVLAEEDGIVCGYACLMTLFETAELLNIAVDSEFRRRGIADLLMKALHDKATELSAERVMLEVRKSNLPAIGLYVKHGYQKIAVRKGYYSDGEDADIMQMDL